MRPADAFAALPEAGLGSLLAGRRPLILAPHPDDESLGCGGLIAAACAAGLPPVVVILTDGAASHPGSRSHPPARLAAVRRAEALAALGILGLPGQNCCFGRAPDGGLAADGGMTGWLTGIAARGDCGMVIGPWAGDPHCDHQAGAALAARVAAQAGVALLSYPVWGWLREDEVAVQGWRLDIAHWLAAKRRAIAAHASQYGGVIRDAPEGFSLPDSLLAITALPYEVYLSR
jgi:LmbE family N-acetylglucosaminyl deacetylase